MLVYKILDEAKSGRNTQGYRIKNRNSGIISTITHGELKLLLIFGAIRIDNSPENLPYFELDSDIIEKLNLTGDVYFESLKGKKNANTIIKSSIEVCDLYIYKKGNKTIVYTLKDCFSFKDNDAENAFAYCNADSLDLRNFDTSRVTNMSHMFECCSARSINLSSFDTSRVTDMSYMFNESSVESLDLSNFDTSEVSGMRAMFSDCKVKSLDLSSFNTSKVDDMNNMFSDCKLDSLNISNFDMSDVSDTEYMFYGCEVVTKVDLRSLNLSADYGYTEGMFDGFKAPELILGSIDMSDASFKNCKTKITIHRG